MGPEWGISSQHNASMVSVISLVAVRCPRNTTQLSNILRDREMATCERNLYFVQVLLPFGRTVCPETGARIVVGCPPSCCCPLYYGANATENITLLRRTLAGPGSCCCCEVGASDFQLFYPSRCTHTVTDCGRNGERFRRFPPVSVSKKFSTSGVRL